MCVVYLLKIYTFGNFCKLLFVGHVSLIGSDFYPINAKILLLLIHFLEICSQNCQNCKKKIEIRNVVAMIDRNLPLTFWDVGDTINWLDL